MIVVMGTWGSSTYYDSFKTKPSIHGKPLSIQHTYCTSIVHIDSVLSMQTLRLVPVAHNIIATAESLGESYVY